MIRFCRSSKDTVLLIIAGLGEISWRNYAFNRNSSHSRGKKAVGFSSSFPAGEGTAASFSLSVGQHLF